MPKGERWQRPEKVVHEKPKFMEECGVKEEWSRPTERSLGLRMPRPSDVTVKNKFRELQVGAMDDEEEDIAAVFDAANVGS